MSGACPGIGMGGGGQNLKAFFVCFLVFLLFNFSGEGPPQKRAEKMIFSTKKVQNIGEIA